MTRMMFVTKGGEYFPPMGIMQISAIAKQNGHKIFICILSKEDVWDKIRKIKPSVIAYSASTGEHIAYFELNKKIKKKYPKIITILGGPHATFFPEGSLEEGGFDAVCIGEGDYAFSEFLDKIEQGKDFSQVKNIMVKRGKKPEIRPLIQDLDSLPFPDRGIFYNIGESGDNPIKHFFIGRGCPFNCSYCFNDAFRGMYPKQRYMRKRSVDNIISEIKEVRKRWPLKYIKFYDDVFCLDADDWLKEFAEKYPKEIGLPFFCLNRADTMTEEVMDLLKKAGCKAMSMSVECAVPRLREKILNRRMNNEQIKKAYRMCGERGIAIQSNNILGLPESTIKDDIATVDFNIECGPKQKTIVIGEFGTAHPYPGTQLGRYCEEKKLYDSKKGFYDMHMSYHDESPLNCFSPEEKRMQRNLTLLGTVAVRFPRTRNIIINHLIKLKPNPLFFAIFYLTKTTQYMRYVYPIGYSFRDYLRVIPQSLKLDWFKRMKGKKWKKK